MRSNMRYRGFTLIELLVAIAIIALLASIIYSNLGSSRAKARDATRISDVGQIQFAIQLYYDRCGQYPSALAISANNGCPSGITLGTFLSQVQIPPAGAGQSAYDYATLTSGGNIVNYVLHAKLEYYNAAIEKGLSSMPGGYSASYTCSNTTTSTDYCITSN